MMLLGKPLVSMQASPFSKSSCRQRIWWEKKIFWSIHFQNWNSIKLF